MKKTILFKNLHYGDELITNGTFDTTTAGWTTIRGSISIETGVLKVIHDNPDSNTFTKQANSNTITTGKKYKISIKYKIVSADSIQLDLRINNITQNSFSSTAVGVGRDWITYNSVFTSTETGTVDFRIFEIGTPSGTDYVYWDNASIKEIL